MGRGFGILLAFIGACSGSADSRDAETSLVDEAGTAWWAEAPRDEDASGAGPIESRASIECQWDDPFTQRFSCSGACHYVLADVSELGDVQNDYVFDDGGQYLVLDQRAGHLLVIQLLTKFAPFMDGTASLPAAPVGEAEVGELPHGVPNYFTHDDPPQLSWIPNAVFETPSWAKVRAAGRYVIGLGAPRNLAHPERWEVLDVYNVTPDGLVDFSPLEGTNVGRDSGYERDIPTVPILLNEAVSFLQWAVPASGSACGPLRELPAQ